MSDPDALRAQMLDRWEHVAPAWGRRADRLQTLAMPVSMWMLEHVALHPGARVLELAAGPGDTGFLAAELITPGGTLLTSDASEAMLEVARERARRLGIENVEFKRLELEWLDLPTASVDAVLCRWGLMLCLDPEAALAEARRVLRPGGAISLAVWDLPEQNPWSTIPTRALVELGHLPPPDRTAPGMFALAPPGRLQQLLEQAGFLEVVVESISLGRGYQDVDQYWEETNELSRYFAEAVEPLTREQRRAVRDRIAELAGSFTAQDGSLELPGRTLVASAQA